MLIGTFPGGIMRFKLHAFTCLILLSASAVSARASTLSRVFQWLESESPRRVHFLDSHARALDAHLAESPNYKPVSDWLRRELDQVYRRQTVKLSNGDQLQLVDRGLNKPTDLVRIHDGQETVLFGNDRQGSDDPIHLVSFTVSPDEAYVALISAARGSIDGMDLRVLDLRTNRWAGDAIHLTQNEAGWMSATALLVNGGPTAGSDGMSVYDVVTGQRRAVGDGGIIAEESGYLVYQLDDDTHVLESRTGTEYTLPDDISVRDLAAVTSDAFFMVTLGPKKLGEVRRFARTQLTLDAGTVVVPEQEGPMSVSADGGSLFVTTRAGEQRRLRVFDFAGQAQADVAIPEYASLRGASWQKPGETLSLMLTSVVNPTRAFAYDVTRAQFTTDPAAALMTANGVTYTTHTVQVKSADGTDVPMRLTHRADLTANGNAPVLLESYGGFNIVGHIDPAYNGVTREFLRRGGIYAGPALRGGGEFGPEWHAQGQRARKINTMNDLIACARWFVTNAWSRAELITSTGTSNGGLTVASAGLLAPDAFGLVIPVSGVLDMLGKERLDPRTDGWAYEYGRSDEAEIRPSLLRLSPLELARRVKPPTFFIVEGRSDTRVNFVHSLKLAAALERFGGRHSSIWLNSVPNSGHWLRSRTYQNMIAWRVESTVWTEIFDRAGWSAARWADLRALDSAGVRRGGSPADWTKFSR